ncbi:MAG: UvrD-helicase domain-containing protein, partial [Nanoarchaeota archaeon]
MINSNTGPCVILAGAGTGKTYALVEKIKYLVQNKHYNPEEIVCLTFSNEAADSLQMRILS